LSEIIQNYMQNYSLYISIFTFLDNRREAKDTELNGSKNYLTLICS
jgi:hypothetical protein